MSDTVLVSLIALIGTIGSGFFSAYMSNRLMSYKIEQLEKKVDKHNNLIDRMYKVEEKVELLENDVEHIESDNSKSK